MGEELPASLEGERVDRVVAMLADVSRSAAAEAIDNGDVLLDGVVVTSRSVRVSAGQMLTIGAAVGAEPAPIPADPSVQVDVRYVDDEVIVVDKRKGQVVHPGSGHATGTIVQGLLALHPEIRDVGDPRRPGVVHRLDKGTTGVFVVARTQSAYDSLVEQLRTRSVRRRYLALVWGVPDARDGIVDAPIGRAIRDPTRMTIRDDGKRARTTYRTLRAWDAPEAALVSCELETGRTHQIRVHLEAIGHPLVGDRRYSGGRRGLELDRPALHAAELGFVHPSSGEMVTFDAPLPADLAALIDALGTPGWSVEGSRR